MKIKLNKNYNIKKSSLQLNEFELNRFSVTLQEA